MKKSLLQAILMFILSAILITAGIVFLPPVTNYGEAALLFIIGVILLIYVFGYLLRRVAKKSKGTVLLLTIIEMSLFTILALTLVLTKVFGKPLFKDGFVILGLAMWIRGVIETFRAYYYRGSSTKYPIYNVVVTILLITGGTYLYFNPIITNLQLIYGLCILFFISAVILIIYGILKLKKK